MTGGPSLVLPGEDEDETQLRWVGTPQYVWAHFQTGWLLSR